jgi:riboflavin biosynthesis pyrimidine reductase
MRKVLLNMTMTLDGFFCGPNGELDWIAQTFVRLGLVDEYVLMVHPVVIGQGQSVFTTKVNLELVGVKTYQSGVIRVCYQPR